jgi:hypothetical protein
MKHSSLSQQILDAIRKGQAAQRAVDKLTIRPAKTKLPEINLKDIPFYNPNCPSCNKRKKLNAAAVKRGRDRKLGKK